MADVTGKQRAALAAQGNAMPNGSYYIRNKDDLRNAIDAVGRARGGAAGRAAVRRFIMKRAKALGLESMIPASWRPDGTLWTKATDDADDAKHGIKDGSPEDMALDKKRGVS